MSLVHTQPHPPDKWLPQTRTAVLGLHGKSLEGYAAFEGGGAQVHVETGGAEGGGREGVAAVTDLTPGKRAQNYFPSPPRLVGSTFSCPNYVLRRRNSPGAPTVDEGFVRRHPAPKRSSLHLFGSTQEAVKMVVRISLLFCLAAVATPALAGEQEAAEAHELANVNQACRVILRSTKAGETSKDNAKKWDECVRTCMGRYPGPVSWFWERCQRGMAGPSGKVKRRKSGDTV